MGASKASLGGIPSTGAESDRLWSTIGRGAAGYTSLQLRQGQQKLYGYAPRHYGGSWSVLREHLTSTVPQGMVIYGSYPLLPSAVKAASRQPSYLGLHAMYVQKAGAGTIDVFDPLGKAGPVTVPVDSIKAFAGVPATVFEHDLYREAEWEEFVDYLKGADPIVNRVAAIGPGATVRTSPRFNPADYNENRIFRIGDAGSSAPARAWVTGTNLTLNDGTVFDADTAWLAIQGKDYGIGYVHRRDILSLRPIEQACSPQELKDAEDRGYDRCRQDAIRAIGAL